MPSALEEAISGTVAGNVRARRRLYELLAQESLYVDAFHPAEPGGAVRLWTTIKSGKLEMAVFSSMDYALACNPDEDAYRVHAPASWLFSEALRLGCAKVWLDLPQCEIPSSDFAALAKGLASGDLPKSVPVQAESRPAPAPPPFVPRTPAPPPPLEDGPAILAPSVRVPGEAQAYLERALRAVPKVTAAYLIDLVMPGEAPLLCLGLRIDLPSSEWNAFVDSDVQFDEIPGLPNGVAVYPLSEEMFETAREVGIKVL